MTDEQHIEAEASVEAEARIETGGPGVPGETESVTEAGELEAVTRERDDYLDALQRLKAEFDNFRKRALRDQDSLIARAGERVVSGLLPVLDDLERALQAAEEHQEAKLEDGVRLVHRSLADVLRREGLEEIPAEGLFDPHRHEAMLAQPSEAEPGTVIDVLQKGYMLGDRVLRPARVIVAE